MVVETRTYSPSEAQVAPALLISPVNENSFRLTQKGGLAFEVVRLNDSLNRHHNPDITFAMSDEQIALVTARREGLCRELSMPEDETQRGAIIAGYQQELEKHGFPPWKVSGVDNAK